MPPHRIQLAIKTAEAPAQLVEMVMTSPSGLSPVTNRACTMLQPPPNQNLIREPESEDILMKTHIRLQLADGGKWLKWLSNHKGTFTDMGHQ